MAQGDVQNMVGDQTHLFRQAKAVKGRAIGDDVAIGARHASAIPVAAPQRQLGKGCIHLAQMGQRTGSPGRWRGHGRPAARRSAA